MKPKRTHRWKKCDGSSSVPLPVPFHALLPLSLLCMFLSLCACAKEDTPPALIHLDPRLVDGGSSAERLAGKKGILSREQFLQGSARKGGWSFQGARILMDSGNPEGVEVCRKSPDRRSEKAIRIVHKMPFNTHIFLDFEVDLECPAAGTARLGWRLAGKGKTQPHFVEAPVRGEEGIQTLRFHPSPMIGDLAELWIEPEFKNKRNIKLRIHEIRIIEKGFSMGFHPIEGSIGDGGLVFLGHEGRRAWPADFEVPLLVRCKVPLGALFSASTALIPTEKDKGAAFILEAREPGQSSWQVLAQQEQRFEEGWKPFHADLDSLAGKEVDLRLLVSRAPGTLSIRQEPKKTQALWGEPVILRRAQAHTHPSVLLITLDTTRADHAGDPVYMPCLTRIGEEGIFFENAWSGCNSTTPSHASILTGKRIYEHGAISNRSILSAENLTLAERFREAGYHTAAAVTIPHIDAEAGFGQGFDRFLNPEPDARLDGAATVERVMEWMSAWEEEGGRPYFLWLHLFDPHTPYRPPGRVVQELADRIGKPVPPPTSQPATTPVFKSRITPNLLWMQAITNHAHMDHLYWSGVYYADQLVHGLLADFDQLGALERTALVITSDHGESLGKRDIWYAHDGLFENTLKVPMVLKVPGGPSGRRIASPVTTLDIVPTLVTLCGLDPIPGLRGENLLALPGKEGDPKRRLWFEYARLDQIATRDGRYQFNDTVGDTLAHGLIKDPDPPHLYLAENVGFPTGSHMLYALDQDPQALVDISAQEPETVKAYRKLLQNWQKGLNRGKVIDRDLSEEELEQLRALGYGGY